MPNSPADIDPATHTFASPLPNIVFEESDGEVVVVDLVSGVYYFLTGPGAYVWLALQSGMTIQACTEAITTAHPAALDVDAGLLDFTTELVALDLLRLAEPAIDRSVAVPDISRYVPGTYTAPRLESFADLQDILLLDPVHDVDPAGWPHEKA